MRKPPSGGSGPVYSSDHGRMCPTCGWPAARCACSRARPTVATPGGIIVVGRETSGRRGKGVTVIRGLPVAGDELTQLATQLKQACASGGTLRDGIIEIQGDHRDRIVAELERRGWKAKRSGG